VDEAATIAPRAMTGSAGQRRERAGRVVLVSLALVAGFWWLATGLVVALQRDGPTRAAAAVIATALAALGAKLLWDARAVTTPRGARLSFVGGALLWAWVAVSFYGGWVVGPAPATILPAGGPSWALAAAAMRATAYNDALSLAVLFGAAAITRAGANRVGLWALALFWGAHQLAKLNVFFGVPNPGVRFLPEHLAFLEAFFGPRRLLVLLPLTVVALAALTVWLGVRAWRAPTPFRRHAAALLMVLAALAALEHALLATTFDVPLWELFLRARGY